jgi:hypothetical protein
MSKKAKKVSKEGYTRIEAFASAIQAKKQGKIEALTIEANKRYVAKGKADNIRESKTVTEQGIKVLVAMGLVTLEDGNYKLL